MLTKERIDKDLDRMYELMHCMTKMKKKSSLSVILDEMIPPFYRIKKYIAILENKNKETFNMLNDIDIDTKNGKLLFYMLGAISEYNKEEGV